MPPAMMMAMASNLAAVNTFCTLVASSTLKQLTNVIKPLRFPPPPRVHSVPDATIKNINPNQKKGNDNQYLALPALSMRLNECQDCNDSMNSVAGFVLNRPVISMQASPRGDYECDI